MKSLAEWVEFFNYKKLYLTIVCEEEECLDLMKIIKNEGSHCYLESTNGSKYSITIVEENPKNK
jgi:hypothetical protein